MSLDVEILKQQVRVTTSVDDAMLERMLAAATKHVERLLGYKLDDELHFEDGIPPDDLEQAVMMIAAHWFENREATVIGVTAQAIPFGATEIINEHRNYTFGLSDV